MNAFTTVLYLLSSALLVPVVVLLIVLFGWSLLTLGDFFGEYLARRRQHNKSSLREGLVDSQEENRVIAGVAYHANDFADDYFPEKLNQIMMDSGSVDEAMLKMDDYMDEAELHLAKRLEKTELTCRVAPMLGLMGTLIPLGPALIALTGGDIETLSKKLVVAFTTTVIGLAASAISLWITTVRRRWYDTDIRAVNQMANHLLSQEKKEVRDGFDLRKMDANKEPLETSSPQKVHGDCEA